jgi:RNA polymerase sigma factor (sigma-70 family)
LTSEAMVGVTRIAKALGLGEQTIRRAIATGELPAFRGSACTAGSASSTCTPGSRATASGASRWTSARTIAYRHACYGRESTPAGRGGRTPRPCRSPSRGCGKDGAVMAREPWGLRPPWENLDGLAEVMRQVELASLPRGLALPELRALAALCDELNLHWTPEGRAVLAERQEAEAQRRAYLAAALERLVVELAAAARARDLATLRTVVDRRRAGWLPRLPDRLGSREDDPAVLLEQDEDQDRLLAQLRSLAPEEQEFLGLAAERVPYREIGERYGISANAVKQRIKRLRRELRTVPGAARTERG